jgi:site-specific recombinase XerD
MRGPKMHLHRPLPRCIDTANQQALWAAAEGLRQEYARYQAVCVLAILYGAGLRRGELERLDVADWDRDASVLRIDGQKTGVERSVPVGEGVWRCIEGTCRIGTIGSKPPGTWNCRTTTPAGFTACG